MNLELGAKPRSTALPASDVRGLLPGNKHMYRVRTYAVLLVLDSLSILVAFAGANLVRSGLAIDTAGVQIAALLLPLYLLIAAQRGVYGSDFFRRWRRTAIDAVAALGIAILAVLFVSFSFHVAGHLSRLVFTIGSALSAISLVALRLTVHRWTIYQLGGEPLTEVLICDRVPAPRSHPGIAVCAETYGLRPDLTDPVALDRLGQLVQHADRVVIACPEDRREAWAVVLKGANVRGEVMCPELGAIGALGASVFAGSPTLKVSVGPLDTRNRAIKRGLDIGLAILAVGALMPLLLLVALAVKLESPGPVLFVQPRLGRGNRLFNMLKFRSMHADLCDRDGRQSTQRGDPRITRVGRLIRATSIDELPQLLNVLRGDMSIVGPRPHALGSLAGEKLFWEIDQRYWHRHAAKPGITGLAQVRGFRGATHLQSDLLDRLQADLDYLNGWTVWRDLYVLVATARVLLHRNAY